MGAKVLFIVKEVETAEPIGLLYVAGRLEEGGHECRLIGTRGTEVEDDVRRFRPDVIAFGATTGLHRYYLGLAAHLKSVHPRGVTLLGGPHATFFPEVIQTPGIDAICRGEGEDTALDFCNAVSQGDDPRRLRGLWVKHEGRIYRNPPRPLRQDLDGLPFPPRRLLYDYDASLRHQPVKSFTTNRGCPFPCSYCFNQALADYYGPCWKKVRVRSPANVIREILDVRREGPMEMVGFRESIFVYRMPWLREFAELYRSEVGLPYYCHLRADLLNEEMVDLLAWSGCHSANVGIETASPELANRVLNRRTNYDRLVRGVRFLKQAGIVILADNMVGIPGGTLEDDLATLRLNIDLDMDYAAATLCTPYPGTAIARYAQDHGYFEGDWDSIDYSYYTQSVLKFPSAKEKRQIENLQKLFAVTVALPVLFPLVKRLIRLPPNDFFYSLFRSWYLLSYWTDVMPRRLTWKQVKDGVLGVFGIYGRRDPNGYPPPGRENLPMEDVPEDSHPDAATQGREWSSPAEEREVSHVP
jgi:radical SAM superfamily enzyme YgiQ (UPF0313 family)